MGYAMGLQSWGGGVAPRGVANPPPNFEPTDLGGQEESQGDKHIAVVALNSSIIFDTFGVGIYNFKSRQSPTLVLKPKASQA